MTARWTHRPTWEQDAHRDRQVLRDGVPVARTYRHEHGPQVGRWQWFGHWEGPGNAGWADSLQAAAAAVRDAWEQRDSNPPSNALQTTLKDSSKPA